jgi:SAM-dependent methyltransferase
LLPFEAELRAQAGRFCRQHCGRLILDVGCGRKAYGGRTIGLDLRPLNLADCRRGVCGDAMHLPFAPDSFEFMLCNAALHQFEDPEQALLEMRRTLRPGGELLLTVPDGFPKTDQPDDYFRFDRTAILDILERTGWSIAKCSPIGGRFWMLSRCSLEWLFKWNRGFHLVVFAIVAPVAGLLLPLACFYAGSFETRMSRTLGWAILARNP